MTPRLLILKTGSTAPEVQAEHGDFDRWFTGALEGEGLAFDVVDATRHAIPANGGHAGILVTGSPAAVYQTEPWMAPLADFLRRAGTGEAPLLGVCFGAQILAHACGGRVERNPRGWEIGGIELNLTPAALDDPLFEGLPPVLKALATHEDHIAALPEGAALLSSNASAAVQAFRLRGQVWGVQFHPEISPAALRLLIQLRRRTLESDARSRGESAEGLMERLLATLDDPARGQAAGVLKNFARLCRRRAATSREPPG